jgi:signal transduction histidine kinase
MKIKAILFSFSLLLSSQAFSIEPVLFNKGSVPFLIGESIEYLEDPSNKLNLDEVISKGGFTTSKAAVPNFNLSKSTFWLHFSIRNNSDEEYLLLDVEQPMADKIVLYTIDESGNRTQTELGDQKKFKERLYDFPSYIFRIKAPQGKNLDCYIEAINHEPLQFPVYLGNENGVINMNVRNETVVGIYVGIILVMFFYNLFLYFSIRDKSYLYYVTYILLIGVTQITLKGYGFKMLWGNNVWMQNHASYIFSSLVGIIVFIFIQDFLQTRKHTPRLTTAMNVIILGYILCIPVALFKFYIAGYLMLQILAMVAAVITLSAAIYAYRLKVASAKYFLIAWITFIFGIVFFVLKDYNVIPYNSFSTNTMPAGSAIELVLISFALANRINILKKEKEISQAEALKASQETQRIISEQNVILDKQVKERTAELETALDDLKRTEVELVNREKMSSLGLLTAGIAHEINNPINFVSASVSPLKRDINDIVSILHKYDKIKNGNVTPEKLAEIQEYKDELDTPFLIEEIQALLNGIEEGAVRTANIVRGLQKFSRSDEHFIKSSDLIDGIENTLTLLNPQLKDTITVVRNFEPIPYLDCSPGKLNQVFLNILSNAIHAVTNNGKKEKIITVGTRLEDNNILLSFKDNGMGMTQEVKEKIFDPFFTTKDVGSGTGLGLSISYGIIENHKGDITVNSAPGEGAEFVIKLPVVNAEQAAT